MVRHADDPNEEDIITDTEQIEDLDISREIECIDFAIGDNVVYPHHGAGQVIKKEQKDILGEKREYLTIKILHNDMTVNVPAENAERIGLRKVNTLDFPISPRGYRILGHIPRLPRLVVQRIVEEFGGLEELLAASDGELETVEGVGEIRAKDIREGLRRLQEINLVDRYLQT